MTHRSFVASVMVSLVASGSALVACRGHDAEPGKSEPAVTPDLKTQLEAVRMAEHLPALGMAVWRGGKLVASAVTGSRKAGDPSHPATIDDQWHLGSDTKAMTATLIGIYVDRGVLHWDDRLDKLFAGVTVDPGYAAVTLDQLLQHRAGAPAELPSDITRQAFADGVAPEARSKLVAAVLAHPPAQAPGTFVYSNAGYVIAGAALERATGKTWEQLMRDELFAPLHMTSCGFGPPGDATKIDEPWGHRDQRPVAPNDPHADNPPSFGPAGTVHCSLGDWGKFLAIHAAPSTPLVSAATMAHLHTAPTGDKHRYMAGWLIAEPHPGDLRLGHEGSNTMWQPRRLHAGRGRRVRGAPDVDRALRALVVAHSGGGDGLPTGTRNSTPITFGLPAAAAGGDPLSKKISSIGRSSSTSCDASGRSRV